MGLVPEEIFAGFVIEGVLGAGGMGAVYTARDPRLDRRVALKVLNDSIAADVRARAAFDRESALAGRLDHPNIVTVFDRSDRSDPDLWLSMRHIPAGDVAGLLRDDPGGLSPRLAVDLIADAAAALDYAHSQGVLHRDVKPANLLIEPDVRRGYRALLTDFGIARTLDDTVTLSTVSATLAYAAPERFTRQAVDHRADIYSLGCTLFHLLTGQPPFPARDQAGVIGAHLTEPVPPPSHLRSSLPPALDPVLATALAKDPGHRYASCAEFAAAAHHALTRAAVGTTEVRITPAGSTPAPLPLTLAHTTAATTAGGSSETAWESSDDPHVSTRELVGVPIMAIALIALGIMLSFQAHDQYEAGLPFGELSAILLPAVASIIAGLALPVRLASRIRNTRR